MHSLAKTSDLNNNCLIIILSLKATITLGLTALQNIPTTTTAKRKQQQETGSCVISF